MAEGQEDAPERGSLQTYLLGGARREGAAHTVTVNEVLPGLFLGPRTALADEYADETLSEGGLGITHVLSAVPDPPEATSRLGEGRWLQVAIDDRVDEDLGRHLRPAAEWIHSVMQLTGEAGARRRLLVHCNAGQSRSASLIIAWLCVHQRHTVASALKLLRGSRPSVSPNPGFCRHLLDLERALWRERRAVAGGPEGPEGADEFEPSVDLAAYTVERIQGLFPAAPKALIRAVGEDLDWDLARVSNDARLIATWQ